MAHVHIYTTHRRKRGSLTPTKEHRWRIVSTNGRIIASASEGYANLADLWNSVRVVRDALGVAIEEGNTI